mgnify:CR=1 FL=1|tara:strand:+ start:1370 stop:2137 length:768 start_codon:yes stop_codon:yes gene_type:complete
MIFFQAFVMKHKEKFMEKIRLNRFIAMCGVCSRRKADILIERGDISINNETITLLGHQVQSLKDVVRYKGDIISPEKKQYILLNKPRGYITTTHDERGRQDVMALIKDACKERIVPVGRLDKETTGLLLFTNDGLLAKKLMHPKHAVPKTYRVKLNRSLKNKDCTHIKKGVLLEDGFVQIDNLIMLDEDNTDLELKIHIGKNRIVRRIFKYLQYDVIKLDRVLYSFLNKDGLKVGNWRKLKMKEVEMLKRDNEIN